MRSGTSCSKTLIRSDWRRFWPAAFLYAFVSFFALPLPLWVGRDRFPARQMLTEQVYDSLPVFVLLAFFFGLFLAMAVYSYLMTGRSVGLLHALPVSRDRQFFSHFAAALSMLTAANALTFVLAVLMEALTGNPVTWKALLLWLAITELSGFFFLALATLAAAVTGWLLAVPVIYVGWNFMAWAYYVILQALADILYTSHVGGSFYGSVACWLTPVVQLMRTVTRRYEVIPPAPAEGVLLPTLHTALIYGAVGLGLLALAWALYRRRRSEAAGDAMAFRPLRPVARYVISIAAGLALGTLVYEMVSSGGRNVVGMILWQVVMGTLVYCAVEMLLRKTYKIFDGRTAAGLLALWLVLAGTCLAMKFDVTGFEKRVPRAEQVESATIYLSGVNMESTDVSDPAAVQAVLDLHRGLLEREDTESGWGVFRVSYRLRGGATLERQYPVDPEDPSLRPALEALVNRPEIRNSLVLEDYGRFGEQFTGGYAAAFLTGRELVLTPEQCLAIYRALEADMARPVSLDEETYTGLSVELTTTQGTYYLWRLRGDCVSTLRVLQELGLIDSADQLDEKHR